MARPWNVTYEAGMKLIPLTVMVNGGSPTVLDDGLIVMFIGTGLLIDVTVNDMAFEVPPPGEGVKTVMSKFPGVARSEARINALS